MLQRIRKITHQSRRIILAGDIGATKTLLALFSSDNNELSVLHEEKLITKDCNELEITIKNFLGNRKTPDAVCLGVAGPVTNNKVNITNIPLSLDSKQLSAALNNTPVHFINDLEATAYGISELKPEDFTTIFEGEQNAAGNIDVVAPGTGLGEAAAFWDGVSIIHFPQKAGIAILRHVLKQILNC
jgi:glucokinase